MENEPQEAVVELLKAFRNFVKTSVVHDFWYSIPPSQEQIDDPVPRPSWKLSGPFDMRPNRPQDAPTYQIERICKSVRISKVDSNGMPVIDCWLHDDDTVTGFRQCLRFDFKQGRDMLADKK